MPSNSNSSTRTTAAGRPATVAAPVAVARRTTPERILDTAEELFALHGYFGTSIRDIMQACGLEFSLARYHFGNKDALFREAIGRRAGEISKQVIASLDALLESTGNMPPGIEAIVTALSTPAFEHLKSGDRGWHNYLRLLTQNSCLLERPDLTAPFYDQYSPAAARYREAFALALPNADTDTVRLVQSFVESVFHLVLNELYARAAKAGANASAPPLSPREVERMRTYLIRFAVGGIDALARPGSPPGNPEH
ncbi:TetR/AcrR family transcriptional regulator [Paraburkholderia sp. BL10I2N1]|uniref:TetR/AcrR family transcriptional regulator n=1 Tax=Paraburkholderia sp. BL10I2N1 TaxID=1938796 RepID=UPI00105BA03A|nr:TetR/AcrR family transcriptional regulator [Paraburkholderia sp. BL10I2N1]TDN59217.1 TetR family transcriptional regulator [Paraburkholderia sp. BL10I2N1]